MTREYRRGDLLKYTNKYEGFSPRTLVGDVFEVKDKVAQDFYALHNKRTGGFQMIHKSNVDKCLKLVDNNITWLGSPNMKITTGVMDTSKILVGSLFNVKDLRVGAKVTVIDDKLTNALLPQMRKKFMGANATIIKVMANSIFPRHIYSLKFDNESLERANLSEGVWLWSADELENVKATTQPTKTEVIEGKDHKIILKGRETTYILYTTKNRYFKGVARLLEGDVYDRERGIQIAKLKAELKALEAETKAKENKLKELMK